MSSSRKQRRHEKRLAERQARKVRLTPQQAQQVVEQAYNTGWADGAHYANLKICQELQGTVTQAMQQVKGIGAKRIEEVHKNILALLEERMKEIESERTGQGLREPGRNEPRDNRN
ncbi:hypothetical protein PMI08_04234 [Brevibacillus sp. CF112]|uniref:hypothetical protein n=1 Tax=Brevibacillus TaxID=55080 RepID=UPI000271D543|nr:hypothetical protein [Brevibacillus sp. CF112]EJL40767.1 hypothetical protein PMI08_04234 [Brevibacillus sp. CF112]